MALVKFKQGSAGDSRVLSAADLQKAGVEGFSKSTFEHGYAYEVPDEVAEALLSHPLFAGEFEEAEEDATEPKAAATDATMTKQAAEGKGGRTPTSTGSGGARRSSTAVSTTGTGSAGGGTTGTSRTSTSSASSTSGA